MNIFFLDINPTQCAQYHVDKHVRKMIVETAQLLSTAHRVLDGIEKTFYVRKFNLLEGESITIKDTILNKKCYKQTHTNHPSSKWVRETSQNYFWAFELLKALLVEFEYRFGKEHKTKETLNFLSQLPKRIPVDGLTEPALAMDEKYIIFHPETFTDHPFLDSTLNYQNYYREGKKHLHNWTKRPVPHFI